jgi:hypothetical protein
MTIPLVFFSLTGLILWFIIGARGHWGIKAFIILLTLHVCLSVGMSIPNFAGWPSGDRLPDKFLVHWITIKEPDKKTKEDGYIYIWATTLSQQEKEVEGWKQYLLSFGVQDFTEPRAYRTPYTREGHERGEDALKKIKNGEPVMGRNNGKKGKGKGKGDGKKGDGKGKGKGGKGKKGGKGGGSFSQSDDISFHDLPETILPEKD